MRLNLQAYFNFFWCIYMKHLKCAYVIVTATYICIYVHMWVYHIACISPPPPRMPKTFFLYLLNASANISCVCVCVYILVIKTFWDRSRSNEDINIYIKQLWTNKKKITVAASKEHIYICSCSIVYMHNTYLGALMRSKKKLFFFGSHRVSVCIS